MSWPNFDGKPYTRAQLSAHINSLDFSRWRRKDGSRGRPLFITLHNTSVPDLALYKSWSPAKRRQYIINVQQYYQGKGWRGGPHYFVPPKLLDDPDVAAFGFNDPVTCGTHCSCFNSDSIGIEMFGEFAKEPFDSGDGASVRDQAVYLMALLHRKIGLNPETIRFHVECKADNHDCPGKLVHKPDIIARVKAEMARLGSSPSAPPLPPALPPPPVGVNHSIKATVFGYPGDENHPRTPSAYGGYVDPDKLQCALPYHFTGTRKKVRITNLSNGKSVVAEINDVGPWVSLTGQDPYWEKGARPKSETTPGTNKAAIDLTPAAAKAIGIDGSGYVDWQFEQGMSGAIATGASIGAASAVGVVAQGGGFEIWQIVLLVFGTLFLAFCVYWFLTHKGD